MDMTDTSRPALLPQSDFVQFRERICHRKVASFTHREQQQDSEETDCTRIFSAPKAATKSQSRTSQDIREQMRCKHSNAALTRLRRFVEHTKWQCGRQ